MQEDFLKKIMESFEKLQKDHNVKPDNESQENLENFLNETLGGFDEEVLAMLRSKTIKVKKLSADAVDPSYAYEGDSGFDLFSIEEIEIPPFGRASIGTGLSVEFEEGFELQIRPKSGLALNQGITVLNTPGTVDFGYSGELRVIVFNTNKDSITITKKMKIAQAVLCPVMNGKFVKFENVEALSNSNRGTKGFGSTGL